MPVPASINDLSTTAGDNSPAGTEAVLPNLDNYLRAHASFIALLNTGTLSLTGGGTVSGSATFSGGTTISNTLAISATTTVTGAISLGGSATATTPAVGTDNTTVATTAFVRDIVPAGVIVMWSGSVASIPAGWALCDGTGGTPDLRNRFIVGAGSTYAVAATGGSADAVVVSHTHTASTASDGAHSHTFSAGNGTGASWPDMDPLDGNDNLTTVTTNSAGAHTHAVTVDSAGVSGTNANLPPYYALAYIMKL